MPRTYRPYEYDYEAPYCGRSELLMSYLNKKISEISIDTEEIKDTIEATIQESLSGIDEQFNGINEHIDERFNGINEHIDNTKTEVVGNITSNIEVSTNTVLEGIESAKNEIIDRCEFDECCLRHLATKQDVANAVTEINEHIDEKFNETQEEFVSLNQLIQNLNNNN